jgi:hypothetical protein
VIWRSDGEQKDWDFRTFNNLSRPDSFVKLFETLFLCLAQGNECLGQMSKVQMTVKRTPKFSRRSHSSRRLLNIIASWSIWTIEQPFRLEYIMWSITWKLNVYSFAESCTVTYFNTSKSSGLTSRPNHQ